ncbi:TRAP transporter substrate-binding protein [Candidimonas humi]|uniref:TRAP transporter substrate-binding protein n=1 Tax=Candidimonas humi TaxID=683355 RepID=A0ABV8P1G9_9BURK|nr:TRAP transporter substrate-binding protein [Candidimonas humi]MBV6305620.1 TRAP transporter substrate-binding protein [Candidimonas humi]
MKASKCRYAAASAVLFSVVALPWAQAQQTTLQLINEYPSTSITAAADLQFAAAVGKQSKGRIEIETLQEKNDPYKGVAQVTAVTEGKTQMGTLFGGILGGKDSLFLLSSLPFAARDFKQAKALYTCAEPALQEHVKALGAHLLYVTPWPPSGIWSVRPLKSVDDVKALKIRTYDATSKSVFERLGAQSVALPYSALAAKLAAGDVNAVLTSGDGGAGRKLWDHLPNFTAVSYSIPLSYTIINAEAWNKLGKDDQAILTSAAQQVAAASWAGVEQRIAANYARMREHKMTLDTTPPEAIMAALKQAGADETKAWLEKNKLSEKDAACLSKAGS